jgi:integrase
LLLITYGLRAREIASLTLDDFDWKRERLHVRERKADHVAVYPLYAVIHNSVASGGDLQQYHDPPPRRCSLGETAPLDQDLDIAAIWADIIKRPYITVGTLSQASYLQQVTQFACYFEIYLKRQEACSQLHPHRYCCTALHLQDYAQARMDLRTGSPADGAAARRSGRVSVRRAGSHTLRHTCVQRLVDSGFPLKTIGDYVGHRSATSTEIYAKVAVETLRDVALGDGEALP